ncbi:MAG: trypsin-like peptidase domain-containing protein [bacterium]|nr:trypsin-like peptidase domain-containing protein [bacterium]
MRPFFKSTATALIAAAIMALPTQAALAEDKNPSGAEIFEKLQDHIGQISDEVKSSVVHIEVVSKKGSKRRKGVGSGLIISADGKIVTNFHVVDHAQSITVSLDDKTKHEAQIIRRDQQTDLALIKIDPEKGQKLHPARLANSDDIKVGQWVLAIGNPYGFDRTVSFGIVSGKGRFIPGIDLGVPIINDFIQTDALIDHGNSGGPLVNLQGEVVGINSVGVGRGLGFTIPVNIVKELINRNEVAGSIQRGYLGVYVQKFSEEHAEYLNKPGLRGVLVSDTVPGGPAEKAGLKSGDIITRINGTDIDTANDDTVSRFILVVSGLEPGATTEAVIQRGNQVITKQIVVSAQPPIQAQEVATDYGFTAKQITQSIQQEFRLEETDGAIVFDVEKDSPAMEAEVQAGDVIVKVENTPIKTIDDFKNAIKALEKKNQNRFLMTLRRGKITTYGLIDTSTYKKSDADEDSNE